MHTHTSVTEGEHMQSVTEHKQAVSTQESCCGSDSVGSISNMLEVILLCCCALLGFMSPFLNS